MTCRTSEVSASTPNVRLVYEVPVNPSDRYAKILGPRNLGQLFVRREDDEPGWTVYAWIRSDADAGHMKIYTSWLRSALDELDRTMDPESIGWFRSKVAEYQWTLPCVLTSDTTYEWC